MAEKTSDAEDRWLESVFRAEPIADDGFSRRVVSKIRRRMWFTRLALPVAAAIGGLIAIGPLAQLVSLFVNVVGKMPFDLLSMPMEFLPQFQMIVLGGLGFGLILVLVKFVDEA